MGKKGYDFEDIIPVETDEPYYRDPENIEDNNEVANEIKTGNVDETSQLLALWIRTKMFGIDVRESLALFVEWLSVKINKIQDGFNELKDRQENLEERQTDLGEDFKDVLASKSTNMEIVNARDSQTFKKVYKVLDDRLEYIETLISTNMPTGFKVTIIHNMGVAPKVKVLAYQNAIDTEADGFDTSDQFGGTIGMEVPTQLNNDDYNTLTINMPLTYKLEGEPIKSQYYDDTWYLINDNQTIQFTLTK